MKLSSYVMTVDGGFAPNPYGTYCTLVCCKPRIRKYAEPGDVVAGFTSAKTGHPGRLIYAMRVNEVLPMDEYAKDARFHYKIPSGRDARTRAGDNIWYRATSGHWKLRPGAAHQRKDFKRDVGGVNALIASEFYYFGRQPKDLGDRFQDIVPQGIGHRNCTDPKLIDSFWTWLVKHSPRRGMFGSPSDVEDGDCVTSCDAPPIC
jgi:hypothetical protein